MYVALLEPHAGHQATQPTFVCAPPFVYRQGLDEAHSLVDGHHQRQGQARLQARPLLYAGRGGGQGRGAGRARLLVGSRD